MMHIISLGAGVQSSTMALMAARGEIGPMPDCAIFADTGWEPKAVYEYLAYLETLLPFPVHRVSAGNIRDDIMAASQGRRWISIPAYGAEGPIRRQCTKEYKLMPIRRKVRELAGLTGKRSPSEPVVTMWIGISWDEVVRMKPSREAWQHNHFPLVDLRMTRRQCLAWMEERQYRMPAKSACVGCPFHSISSWRDKKNNRPEEFADAVEVDAAIRTGVRGMTSPLFLHASRLPLDQVDLRTDKEMGQPDLFTAECEGMCGV